MTQRVYDPSRAERLPYQDLPYSDLGFNPDDWEWASCFECPVHGAATPRMVMTTKCCGYCNADGRTQGLIRLLSPHPDWRKRYEERGIRH